eukprot:63542_1
MSEPHFNRFATVPCKFDSVHSNAIYYQGKDGECFIVASNPTEGKTKPGIYKLKLRETSWSCLSEYPSEIEMNCMCIAIDKSDDIIYFTDNKLSKIITFDLKDQSWKLYDIDTKYEKFFAGCYEYHRYVSLASNSSAYNQIHIGSVKFGHYIFNISRQELIKINTEFPYNTKLLHIPSMQQMMMLTTSVYHNNLIHFYKIAETDQTSHKCQLYPLKLHYESEKRIGVTYLLVFETLLFVFYGYEEFDWGSTEIGGDIYCLDLFKTKWYKLPYKLPKNYDPGFEFDGSRVVKSRDNYAYFLNFRTQKFIGRISLYELIPKQLYESYKQYYELLIMGNLRELEKNKQYPHLPHVLKKWIVQYFPCFV